MENVPTDLIGRRIVIKLGGEIMLNRPGLDSLSRDMAALVENGAAVTIVHGGGPQADALAEELGHTVRKVAGRRITDDDALEVAKMVYGGSTNIELLAALTRNGARPVGLSGIDAGLITVTRRPPTLMKDPKTGLQEMVDFGHVGDITGTRTDLLDLLHLNGYLPVVASLAADPLGNIYNVNADTVAQTLAVALRAERLVLVTNVAGIMLDPANPSTLIKQCTIQQLRDLISSGIVSGGMTPKAQNCIDAIQAGVQSVQIIDGTGESPHLLRSITGQASGTLITA
ncbi:MAG: acetylglutamate kinase [Chloroflexota bacterium]